MKPQGARLVAFIRAFERCHHRRPTYLELVMSGISVCPWKRLQEPAAQAALKNGERVLRGKDDKGRVVFMIA
jgi:hypothetical protein